jgi:hypothetical protein
LPIRTVFVSVPFFVVSVSHIYFSIPFNVLRILRRTARHASIRNRYIMPVQVPRRISKRIILSLCVLLFAAFLFVVARFVRYQLQELGSLSFSTINQETLPENIHDVSYSSDEVFSVLLVSEEVLHERAVTQGFAIIRLDMASHKADVITLHPDLSIPLQYVPGLPADSLNLSISKVRDLSVIGDLQVEPIPFAYLYYQLQELYALPIDGYVVFPEDIAEQVGVFAGVGSPADAVDGHKGYEEWSEEWANYWTGFFRSVSLFKIWMHRDLVPGIDSNMDVVDLYTFVHDFAALPEKSVAVHVLSDAMVEKTIDERGEQVSVVSISSIDAVLSELGKDDRMDREQARIEIFNGTEISGWGSRYERWVKHLGGDVIRVKNAPQQSHGTVIFVTDRDEYAYTVDRISSLWDHVTITEGRPDFITTGDIIIVLGVDF